MEITVGNSTTDDLIEVTVHYNEMIDDYRYSAKVNVWVKNTDSRAKVRELASEAAHKFLQRALSAHRASDQPQ